MSIQYDDSALFTKVGGWIGDNTKTKDTKVSEKHAFQPELSKKGLGYHATNKIKLGNKRDRIANSIESVFEKRARNDRLKKNDLHQGGGDNEADDDEQNDLHGVVEDFSESRTSQPSKGHAAPQEARPILEKSVAGKDTGDGSPASKKTNRRNEISRGIKPGKGGYWAIVHEHGEDSAGSAPRGDVDGLRRKRPKTRSKQKNIRKDNRSAEVKPSFRPLSMETKQLLQRREG